MTVPRIGLGTWELIDGDAYDSGIDRDEVFVTTKVWMEKAAPDDVESSTGRSLARLGLDHVDLLLIHWPTDVAPIEATIEALADQQARDRTRLVGVSNYTPAQFQRAAKVAEEVGASVAQVALAWLLRQIDPPFAPDWD